MTVQQFNKFARAEPFEPFVIHLADQRFFGVMHRDAVALSETGRTLMILNDDRKIEVVDMLLVVSLRPFSDLEARAGFPIKR